MKDKFRCNCPVTSALDIVGDKWTLIIVRDMLLEGKKTFKDFSESEEAIATNILSSRLKMLEEFKLLTKSKLPNNKKANIYRLTEKGISLAPVIVELVLWSYENVGEFNAGLVPDDRLDYMKKNKAEFIKSLQDSYQEKVDDLSDY